MENIIFLFLMSSREMFDTPMTTLNSSKKIRLDSEANELLDTNYYSSLVNDNSNNPASNSMTTLTRQRTSFTSDYSPSEADWLTESYLREDITLDNQVSLFQATRKRPIDIRYTERHNWNKRNNCKQLTFFGLIIKQRMTFTRNLF